MQDFLWSQRDGISFEEDPRFDVYPPRGPWEIIQFRADLRFHATGHVLESYETYSRDANGKPLRGIRYCLVCPEGKQVFRFDTHGRQCEFNEPCHVHTVAGEVLANGDSKLRGYDLAKVDFPKVFSLAYRYIFEYEDLPWE